MTEKTTFIATLPQKEYVANHGKTAFIGLIVDKKCRNSKNFSRNIYLGALQIFLMIKSAPAFKSKRLRTTGLYSKRIARIQFLQIVTWISSILLKLDTMFLGTTSL